MPYRLSPGQAPLWESLGIVLATSRGTTLTAGSANVKGSYVFLGTATQTYEEIYLTITRPSASADYLIDLSINVSGNQFDILPNLRLSNTPSNGSGDQSEIYRIPIHIPSGSVLNARIACSTGSATLDISLIGMSSGVGGIAGFTRAVALYTPATSRGVTLDAGAVANSNPGWTQIMASTPARVSAIIAMIGHNADATRGAVGSGLLSVGFGPAGQEQIAIINQPFCWFGGALVTVSRINPATFGPFACDIPAGSRLVAQIRSGNTTAGDRTVDFGAIGLVA